MRHAQKPDGQPLTWENAGDDHMRNRRTPSLEIGAAHWIGLLALGATIEALAIRRHNGTASQMLANLFRIQTRTGKAAFTVALGAGTTALWRHIIGWDTPDE